MNNRKIMIKMVLIMACILSMISCDENAVTISLSGDLRGHLEDCGCPSGKLGGIARRISLLDNSYTSYKKTINFDSGNFSGGPSHDGKEKTLSVLKIYKELELSAVNIGADDIANGLIEIAINNSEYMPKLISSNIKYTHDLDLFEEYILVEASSNIKIGVVGVTSTNVKSHMPEGVEIVEARKALLDLVPDLKNKTHMIILLASMPRREIVKLIKEVRGIDLVLGSDGYSITHEVYNMNGTSVVYTGGLGKYLGLISIKHSRSDGVVLEEFNLQPLTDNIKENVLVKNIIDKEKRRISDSIYKVQKEKETGIHGRKVERYLYCNNCHSKEMGIWKETRHANLTEKAKINTLVKTREQEYLMVGESVNCVTCHGYNENHCVDPKKYCNNLKVNKNKCLNCHIESRDEKLGSFYEMNWEKIKH